MQQYNAAVTEEGIVTAVEVTSAAEKDDKQTGAIREKREEAGLKPKYLDADSAYGYIETFTVAKEKGIRLNAPFRGFDKQGMPVYGPGCNKETNTLPAKIISPQKVMEKIN